MIEIDLDEKGSFKEFKITSKKRDLAEELEKLKDVFFNE